MSTQTNLYSDVSSLAVPPFKNENDGIVELSKSEICDDPNVDDVWDSNELIFCGHGRECCELCGTNHRWSNAHKGIYAVSGDDEIMDADDALGQMERKLQGALQFEKGGGPNLTIGTKYSHDLMIEIYRRPEYFSKIQPLLLSNTLRGLPQDIPPQYTPLPNGTKVTIKNLVTREDLNGEVGCIVQFVKAKNRHGVRLANGSVVAVIPDNLDPVPVNEITSLQELEHALASCQEGGEIVIGPGRFRPNSGILVIPGKGIVLKSSTPTSNLKETVLDCTLKTTPGAKGNLFQLQNIKVTNGFEIEDNSYGKILITDCHLACNDPHRDNINVGDCSGTKCTFLKCTIEGGSDGLMHGSHTTKLEIVSSTIKNVGSRGIFANADFMIKDSVIKSCGSYGIKCRDGCDVRGNCDIQPGPWDTFGTAGGMDSSGDVYGHQDTFVNLHSSSAMEAAEDLNMRGYY
mmetsp:Transcript_15191/g.17985  ORF Transcript_15191/g.17985 Transcript_15191/m.17985 type:complete len:459 (+) Transcript_15191:79-1455(+)